ncbi:MAG TPA: GIY-YIG nuclease family protein [Gemmatimonadales bacterium]|jgi:putative endonuclease|nr:GIY-YIG nuclease family protein [Gemmatimonadales bacterium]
MRDTPYAVYILTSRQRRVLYTGITNDLRRRVAEHRSSQGGAFSRRYALDTLV